MAIAVIARIGKGMGRVKSHEARDFCLKNKIPWVGRCVKRLSVAGHDAGDAPGGVGEGEAPRHDGRTRPTLALWSYSAREELQATGGYKPRS